MWMLKYIWLYNVGTLIDRTQGSWRMIHTDYRRLAGVVYDIIKSSPAEVVRHTAPGTDPEREASRVKVE